MPRRLSSEVVVYAGIVGHGKDRGEEKKTEKKATVLARRGFGTVVPHISQYTTQSKKKRVNHNFLYGISDQGTGFQLTFKDNSFSNPRYEYPVIFLTRDLDMVEKLTVRLHNSPSLGNQDTG